MHFLAIIATLAIAFIAGWAFYKHRTAIKADAEAEAAKLKTSAEAEVKKL